jgi:hypothetical protein
MSVKSVLVLLLSLQWCLGRVIILRRILPHIFSLFLLITAACSQPGNPSPANSWTTFQDPAEQAFTIDVPRGWKITGGLYRFGPLDPRIMVDMVSPDGKTDIRIGDYRVPPFAILTQTLRATGFHEGSLYNPRNMAQMRVANYRPGWVFADVYGQGRFSRLCSNLRLKSMQKEKPVHSNQGFAATDAGDVVYACESSAGTQLAYVFAETQLTQMQSVGNWSVNFLYSFITPQSQGAETVKILYHALSTFQISQQWYRRQLQINGQAADTAMRDFEHNMSSIRSDYERRTAASQSQFESFDRALRGVDLVTDNIDGKPREVWNGTGGRHWENGMGDVMNAPSQPSGTQEMKPVP